MFKLVSKEVYTLYRDYTNAHGDRNKKYILYKIYRLWSFTFIAEGFVTLCIINETRQNS